MFNLFKQSNKEPQNPEWVKELDEKKGRWFAFLDKLEARMEELCTAAIPELKEAFSADEDIHKRTSSRLYSGIMGQMNNIREKASNIYEEEINNTFYEFKAGIDVLHPLHNYLYGFRSQCSDRHRAFEDKYIEWTYRLEATQRRDYEKDYRDIVEEFEQIKNKFTCNQCGSPIPVDKIYFTTTYLKCPACQTQNTFEPSTKAKMLEDTGRGLAEQRTAHLLKAYNDAQKKERELYHQAHDLKLDNIRKKDAKVEMQIENLKKERAEVEKNTPDLYRKYLRAMFDEWNKIVPDLKEQNEKFYMRLLGEFDEGIATNVRHVE